jgi:ATP-binding cassette subfamily B protein
MMGGLGWHVLSYGAKAETTPVTWAALRRIVGYFKPYRREAFGVLIVILLSAFLGLFPPLLLRALLDDVIPARDMTRLHWYCAAMIIIPLVTGLLSVLETWLDERLSQGVILDLRQELFGRLQGQSMDYFTNTRPGEISSRLNNDVNELSDIFSDTVVALTSNVVILCSTAVVIVALNWQLALLALLVVPCFIPPAWQVGKIRQRIMTALNNNRADLHAMVQDAMSINGFLIRRVFGHRHLELEQYRAVARENGRLSMQRMLVWRWFMLALGLFGFIGPALVYWYGGHLAMVGTLSVGTIVAFVAYLGRLYGPVAALATIHVQVLSAFAVWNRLFVMLDAPPAVQDQPDAKTLSSVEGHIVFEQVGFQYRADRRLLEGISFEAHPGQLVALVGPSGAGKTTLTYLLSRFYDPTQGRITLDGHDLRAVTLDSLQAQMATVTQEPFLFHTTLRENLLLAKPGATMTELEAACRAASIHDAITRLPEGYDTVVGERGYRLSGGEKQRLALARVILKSPRILILDEATSSLDSQSETFIQQALQPLMANRTTVAIAHRLSTVIHADLILVLDGGCVVERGTHDQLLRINGLYARLYHEQFKAGAPEAASAK